MSKHTSGPWKVSNSDNELSVVTGDDKYLISKIVGDDRIPGCEDQANARLIAAAPDLLEACKIWVHNEKCTCEDGLGSDCPWCFTKQAIAKAEGGSGAT